MTEKTPVNLTLTAFGYTLHLRLTLAFSFTRPNARP